MRRLRYWQAYLGDWEAPKLPVVYDGSWPGTAGEHPQPPVSLVPHC